MAHMLYEFVKLEFNVVAFTVDRDCIASEIICGLPLIPFDLILQEYPPEDYYMLIAVGFIDMNNVRQDKYFEAKKKGYQFINYIHPSVVRHDSLVMGENNIILDHASLHPFTILGDSNFVSSNTNIGHGCFIGNNNWINAGVSVGGETIIKDNVFLGINSSLSHGLLIDDKTFVGANTQINRSTAKGDVFLTECGEKHRLKSEIFLKFSNAIKPNNNK